jgi:hypothetical protein
VRTAILALAAPAAALVLAAPGCDSAPLAADPAGELVLTAAAKTIVIDQVAGETEGTSAIAAQVFDASGLPMKDVAITFTTSGGTLASNGEPVDTNAAGTATDVLTLRTADPSTVTITARSARVRGEVTVDKTLDTGNLVPEAAIGVPPTAKQRRGLQIEFDGTASADLDGTITCYQWRFDSTNDADDEVIQGGPSVSRVNKAFGRLGDFRDDRSDVVTVTLYVSDDPDAPTTFCAPGADAAPIAAFNGIPASRVDYEIACDLTAPTSVSAGLDRTVEVDANGRASVRLAATGTDAESAVTYRWECNDAAGTVQVGPDPTATCTYVNRGPSAITFTPQITVTNACGMSTSETVDVVVAP